MVQLKSAPVFEQIKAGIKEKPEMAKSVNAIILYVLTKDGKEVGRYSKTILEFPGFKDPKLSSYTYFQPSISRTVPDRSTKAM